VTEDLNDLDPGLDIRQDAVKFANSVNIAQLYHQFYANLSALFRTTSAAHAIEYFYNLLPPFLILEDKEFRDQYIKIEKEYSGNVVQMYQLHHSELIRLLTRAGIMPRPDVILKLYADDAPRSVEEMRGEEVQDDAESP
jgi:hypothetical protein